jgi:uncharacterized membrane protein YedE/YeeE
MSSTGRRGTRRSRGVVLAMAALVALVGVACAPEPFVGEGTTFGYSESFVIEAGTHAISWSAWDAASPGDGCLFGLLLDPEALAATDVAPPPGFDIPKLAYEVLDGGGSLNGLMAMELPAGKYRFVIEGSCAWSVRVDRH